jgi:hypothetical protein
MRVVGLDIDRVFAEAVMLADGRIRRLGRIGMTREHLEAFARRLTRDDHVVVEATGNATAVAEVIGPLVGRAAIANPRQVRLIAEARIKTDVVDATVLARLYASGFLPEVWVPDQRTLALRRQVTRRNQIVRQRARLKTIIQSILHAHLVPPCPHADPCSGRRDGRGCWGRSSRPTSGTRWPATGASTTASARISGPWSGRSLATRSPTRTPSGSWPSPASTWWSPRACWRRSARSSASPVPTSSSPISA